MKAPERLYLSETIYSTYLYQVPDPDEEPEVERTIIWEDEKMMGKHLFQGQWKPKIDVFGRKERWCYLSDILNL